MQVCFDFLVFLILFHIFFCKRIDTWNALDFFLIYQFVWYIFLFINVNDNLFFFIVFIFCLIWVRSFVPYTIILLSQVKQIQYYTMKIRLYTYGSNHLTVVFIYKYTYIVISMYYIIIIIFISYKILDISKRPYKIDMCICKYEI